MTRPFLVAAVAFIVNVGSANAWQQGERVAQKHCERGHVLSCIHRAALHQRVSYGLMLGLARCESRFSPSAHNASGATGLFQIMYPGTWGTTPYRSRSPWAAKWNALAAGWMLARGRRGEWVC